MKKNFKIPEDDEMKALASKFTFDIDEYGMENFLKFLSEFLMDDTDLIALKPNPSDETFHIVKKQAFFAGYIGGAQYFKNKNIIELIWMAIGLHTILDVELPERLINLAIFLTKYFKASDILRKKEKKILPKIVIKKLLKHGEFDDFSM